MVLYWLNVFAYNLFSSLIFFIIGYKFLKNKFDTGIRLTASIIGGFSGLFGFGLTHLSAWTNRATITNLNALEALMNIVAWAVIGFAVGTHYRSKGKAKNSS